MLRIGDKFGYLTVISFSDKKIYGGSLKKFWICKCGKCNRHEEFYEHSKILRSRGYCTICARGPCVICGSEITAKTNSNVCSKSCYVIKRRNMWNLCYAKLITDDPDHNKKRYQILKENMNKDSEYYAKIRNANNKSNAEYRKTAAYQQKSSDYQARRFYLYKEEIMQKRKDFFEALSEEEKNLRKEKNKEYWKKSAQKYRDYVKQNPEEYKKYIEYQRKHQRAYDRRKELSKLISDSQKLLEIKK